MSTGPLIESLERDADDGVRRCRDLLQVTTTPNGSRSVQKETYYYKPTPAGEEPGPARDSRLRAKRRARANCELKFDSAARAEARKKRNEGAPQPPHPPCPHFPTPLCCFAVRAAERAKHKENAAAEEPVLEPTAAQAAAQSYLNILRVPTSVKLQGSAAVAAWIVENHPSNAAMRTVRGCV